MRKYIAYKGFTIVELVAVIVIIGILATVVIVGYGAWRKNIAVTQMTSDLSGVQTAMASERNFNNAFPESIPNSFVKSEGVTLTYVSGDAASYCIEAISVGGGSTKFFLDSTDSSTPKEGSCPAPPLPPPATPGAIQTAIVTGTQVQLGWSAVAEATSYDVQYRRDGGTWTVVAAGSTSVTVTGLVASSTYDFQVRAKNGGMASAWSGSTSRKTVPTPTIISASDLGCGNDGSSSSWLHVSVTWTATSTTYTTSYLLEGTSGFTYGYTPRTVANPTGTGNLTTTTSSTMWHPAGYGAGTIYLYGIGPNGEKSSAATWSSATYSPFDC